MNKPKIYTHCSYIGTTGYNNHTRDFFRQLRKYLPLKVRNFTVGDSWKGINDTPHEGEKYLDDIDRSLLYKQVCYTNEGTRADYNIYSSENKNWNHDINLVLSETNHHLFYDSYSGPKIAYNVWESTLQPEEFFNKLKEFDEFWVPSKWQKECSIKQGYPKDKIKVVPEGVDVHVFYPNSQVKHKLTSDGRFKFFLAGRWDYRKSTKEIIETFLKTFGKDEPVDLIVSIDNMWGKDLDGFETTEERLSHYNLIDPRIKILHFPSRTDYIDLLKSCNVFVSCARSEGWNLPLIESMACGTPSIYSNCSGQLEFAEGKGIPVNILGEKSADTNSYARYKMSDLPGNYYEPDFEHLSQQMRFAYECYDQVKENALIESKEIRDNFNWEKIGQIGYQTLMKFYEKHKEKNTHLKNEIKFNYLDGPKVEVIGDKFEHYKVEFLDETDNVIYEDTITNNMWTKCSRKYYTGWKIRVNGIVIDKLNLKDKRVLICLESKAIGDTVAWAPYAVDFAKKHNCKVVLCTFFNDWFKKLEEYKDIEFIEPGKTTECYTVYRIGWFRGDTGKWDRFDMQPNQVNLIPLQQTATDILGLEFKELNYGLDFQAIQDPLNKPYVVFAPNATSGCKEWNYENWVELSKLIKKLGYEIIVLTKSSYDIPGTTNVYGKPLKVVANYLYHAKAFIGLGSGLSWFNWALGNHTYMINGFAKPGHEFTSRVTRIYNDNVCIFCWNDPVHAFDAGDWNWCPVYKGTKLQHICQKSITPLQVFNSLKI
jgi:autotransporter strand-loop-strand O-heptosyltransferase